MCTAGPDLQAAASALNSRNTPSALAAAQQLQASTTAQTPTRVLSAHLRQPVAQPAGQADPDPHSDVNSTQAFSAAARLPSFTTLQEPYSSSQPVSADRAVPLQLQQHQPNRRRPHSSAMSEAPATYRHPAASSSAAASTAAPARAGRARLRYSKQKLLDIHAAERIVGARLPAAIRYVSE